MAKEESFTMQGYVIQALANTQFLVKLPEHESEILCYVTGNMRRNFIRIIPGDEVTVEISPYDLTKGRIVFRGKPRNYSDSGEGQSNGGGKKKKQRR
jgi:translation initiation factor IF-1